MQQESIENNGVLGICGTNIKIKANIFNVAFKQTKTDIFIWNKLYIIVIRCDLVQECNIKNTI